MITNRFERFFDEMFNKTLFTTPFNLMPQKALQVNVYRNEKGYELHLKAPGLTKEDFEIEVENNVLSLTGKYAENEKYMRRFELPENIDSDKVTAKMNDGILTLILPEQEEKKPQRIEILSA